jgi:hypothetical protein
MRLRQAGVVTPPGGRKALNVHQLLFLIRLDARGQRRRYLGILWPPLGGFPRIPIEGFAELIPLFAKVPNRFWKIGCMVGKYPGKFIATRLAKVFFLEIGVFFLAGSHDPIKKMAPHKFVIGDTVKFVAFHPIVFVEITIGKIKLAATPHIDSQSQISMDNPLNFAIPADFEQHILPVGLE